VEASQKTEENELLTWMCFLACALMCSGQHVGDGLGLSPTATAFCVYGFVEVPGSCSRLLCTSDRLRKCTWSSFARASDACCARLRALRVCWGSVNVFQRAVNAMYHAPCALEWVRGWGRASGTGLGPAEEG
jgi:hypothetical protein